MSDDEIRVAVAESLGWKGIQREVIGYNGLNEPWHDLIGIPPKEHRERDTVPDYCNDLNAMHAAEKCLTPQSCNIYEVRLGLFNTANDPPELRSFHKTARQRAEAYLRCLGLWRETPVAKVT